MKIVADETEKLLVISFDNNGDFLDMTIKMTDGKYTIDGVDYMSIWIEVCKQIISSRLLSKKRISVGVYQIFYWKSSSNLIVKFQRDLFRFTAIMANLEIERLEKLLANKYGEQKKLAV